MGGESARRGRGRRGQRFRASKELPTHTYRTHLVDGTGGGIVDGEVEVRKADDLGPLQLDDEGGHDAVVDEAEPLLAHPFGEHAHGAMAGLAVGRQVRCRRLPERREREGRRGAAQAGAVIRTAI